MLRHKAVKPDSSLAHDATTLENELSLLRNLKHHYHVCSNQHNASGGIWQRVLLVFIVVLIVASNAPFPGLLLQRDSFVTKSVHHHTLNSTQTTGGWIRPTKIYGHVHMAKTAGTDINGELANHYERVCGHKGYSYDALKTNLRTIAAYDKGITGPRLVSADLGESVSKLHPGFNRGTVPERIADEIGYDDCDYISKELDAKVWHRFSRNWEMELHVPCRDPLSHLMSQCNHRHHKFDCDADDLGKEISNCTVEMNRFSMKLQDDPNITLKCFDPVPPSKYVDYMGTILQRKRIESEYFHRDTNNRRNKSDECMWNTGEDFQSRVLSKLMELEYYAYCDLCMGSGGELPLV